MIMKHTKLFALLAVSASLVSPAFAGDGAENANINIDNQNNGAVIAISEIKTGPLKAGSSKGEAVAGSVAIKGSVKNSNINVKNKNNGAVIAIGNAKAGSVTMDFTNH